MTKEGLISHTAQNTDLKNIPVEKTLVDYANNLIN